MSAIPSTPKRKRAQSPFTTDLADSTSNDVVEGGSPRARIVTKFQDLQLRSVDNSGPALDDNDVPNDLGSLTASQGPRKRSKLGHKDGSDEKSMTVLDCRDEDMNSISTAADATASGHDPGKTTKDVSDSDGSTSDNKYKSQKRQCATSVTELGILDTSPPSKSQSASLPKARSNRSPPPSSQSENTSSLVWQDSEITGHLMDDPDDDGVGINGLGFKPSSTIAYARAQKRKQQIAEWRARESREARQKRGERRWRGTADGHEARSLEHRAASGRVGKAVRFAARESA